MSEGFGSRFRTWLRRNRDDLIPFFVAAALTPVLVFVGGAHAGLPIIATLAIGTVTIGLPAYVLCGLPAFWLVLRDRPKSLWCRVLELTAVGAAANLATYPLYRPFLSHGDAALVVGLGFPAAMLAGIVFAFIHALTDRIWKKRARRSGAVTGGAP